MKITVTVDVNYCFHELLQNKPKNNSAAKPFG